MKAFPLHLMRSVLAIALFICVKSVIAQNNSWIGSGSGDWESPEWSLGLPAAGEDIFITNAGSKTIVIEPITVEHYPQSLYVQSLTISSPGNSSNEILMNKAGHDVPLIVGDTNGFAGVLVLSDTNSSFDMVGSSLVVNNSENYATADYDGAFYVAGTFNETASSTVNCRSIYVGNLAPGVFNLKDSLLNTAGAEYIGGFPSSFSQNGGTNACALLGLNSGGQYNFYGGSFLGQIQFKGGQFTQYGGNISSALSFTTWSDNYLLAGGALALGDVNLSVGGITQTGGTNSCGLISEGFDSSPYGPGQGYSLQGGYLSSSAVYINYWQGAGAGQTLGYNFSQSGGYHLTGGISLQGGLGYGMDPSYAIYNLSGGILSAQVVGMALGYFDQSGGTNVIGTISIGTSRSGNVSIYSLSGGQLVATNIQVNGPPLYTDLTSHYLQSGGTNQTAQFSINPGQGNWIPAPYAALSGGALIAQSCYIGNACWLAHSGGTLKIPGILTLDGGIYYEQTNGASLGQLRLGAGTNSIIQFPTNTCHLVFSNSSSVTWSNTGVLTIVDWNGHTNGFGTSVLVVGTNAHGLTSLQLAQIQFANPAGFPSGYYTAKILANGQLVPSDPSYLNAAPAPFFTGEASLGSGWYYLSASNHAFGIYELDDFPYVYHADLDWEYFIDAADAQQGAYFYDFADSAFFYTQPALFPYLYDFNANAWVYYAPLPNSTGRYSSNPRWFYNYSTQAWTNHL